MPRLSRSLLMLSLVLAIAPGMARADGEAPPCERGLDDLVSGFDAMQAYRPELKNKGAQELTAVEEVAYQTLPPGGRYIDRRACRARLVLADGEDILVGWILQGKGAEGLLGYGFSPCFGRYDSTPQSPACVDTVQAP